MGKTNWKKKYIKNDKKPEINGQQKSGHCFCVKNVIMYSKQMQTIFHDNVGNLLGKRKYAISHPISPTPKIIKKIFLEVDYTLRYFANCWQNK